MTKDEALRMAIEDLEVVWGKDRESVIACKEALEQPTQGIELAWYVKGWDDAKKQWQGLSDDEIDELHEHSVALGEDFAFARSIEAKLREKNG